MVLETERLRLRPFEEGDLTDLYQYLSDPEVVRFEPYRAMSRDQVRENLAWRVSTNEMIAAELKETGRVIGNVYLGERDFQALELGFVFHRGYWGRGLAGEACRAAVGRAFAEGAHRVFAECDPENENSWRLLEALGFRREGHLRRNVFFWRDGEGRPIWKDTYLYATLGPIAEASGERQ